MDSRIFVAFVIGVNFTVACSDSVNADNVINDFEKTSGLSFQNCGTVDLGHCLETLEFVENRENVLQCLVNSSTTCLAARGKLSRATVEGDPIFYTYFIVPNDKGCSVVRFVDTTHDDFGKHKVLQYSCDKLTRSADSCPPLSECGTEPEEEYQ